MMETSRVLTMLNAQASRQLQNEQFESAKRTVNEAIRYYEDSKSFSRSSSSSSGPHEDALVRCQAQVSVLLKLKIARREAALGAQTNNDSLSQAAQKMITQSTRSLRGIINDSRKPPAASHVSPSESALSELNQASQPIQPGTLTVKTKDSISVASSLSSNQSLGNVYVVPHPPSVNIPLSASVISVASKPTALEEWYQLTRTMHTPHSIPWEASSRNINNNCIATSNKDKVEDLGYCDCFAQIKRKAQQHAAVQQAQEQTPRIPTTITSPPSTEAASVDEMVEPQTKDL